MARKRSIRILLIPILAPLFLIGWLLAFSGQKKAENKKSRQKATEQTDPKRGVLEMGVLPEAADQELSEAPLKTENSD